MVRLRSQKSATFPVFFTWTIHKKKYINFSDDSDMNAALLFLLLLFRRATMVNWNSAPHKKILFSIFYGILHFFYCYYNVFLIWIPFCIFSVDCLWINERNSCFWRRMKRFFFLLFLYAFYFRYPSPSGSLCEFYRKKVYLTKKKNKNCSSSESVSRRRTRSGWKWVGKRFEMVKINEAHWKV